MSPTSRAPMNPFGERSVVLDEEIHGGRTGIESGARTSSSSGPYLIGVNVDTFPATRTTRRDARHRPSLPLLVSFLRRTDVSVGYTSRISFGVNPTVLESEDFLKFGASV